MRVESGSMNASRIPGTYAYPVQRYNNRPVESVSRVTASSEFMGRVEDMPENSTRVWRDGDIKSDFRNEEEPFTYTPNGIPQHAGTRVNLNSAQVGRFFDIMA